LGGGGVNRPSRCRRRVWRSAVSARRC